MFTGAQMDDIYKLNHTPAYLKQFNLRSDYKQADNVTDIVDYNTLHMNRTFYKENDLEFIKHPHIKKINQQKHMYKDDHNLFSKLLKE